MNNWKKYFKVIKIIPGMIIHPGLGRFDLREDLIPIQKIHSLYKKGCPYLAPTDYWKALFTDPDNSPNVDVVVNLIEGSVIPEDAIFFSKLKSKSVIVKRALTKKLSQLLSK